MMMKGPFREFIPVDAQVKVKIPDGATVSGVRLLVADIKSTFTKSGDSIVLKVSGITDHEIVAIDFN
jgi:hypothetical protein